MTLASLLDPNMPTGEPKHGSVIYDKFGGANLWAGNKPPLPPPGMPPGGFLNDPGFGGENAAVGPGHPDYEESTMTALPKIKPSPGMPDPINTPYQRNEDLDLTNRANVMQEFKNWMMGGHGTQGAVPMMSRTGMQFMGEEMPSGLSTYFGDFRRFLDTFGIGDRLIDPNQQQMFKADPPQTKFDPPSGPPGGMTPFPSPPVGGPPGIIPPGSDQIIDPRQPPSGPYRPIQRLPSPGEDRKRQPDWQGFPPQLWPPRGRPWEPPGGPGVPVGGPKPQPPWAGFGETLGGFEEKLGGFGEQLGGYEDLLSGFGDKFGSFGEKLGGFKDEFSGINDKLQGLEQGIASLTDKFGEQQQQQQQRPQQNYMNPFGSFNSYNPYFGGLGAFMRRY
jgi:hypothetical protein|tara:strand:- start:158 stop:1324 length:1167 start_codon:yes stop_codon:yes gene_type:complete